MFNSNRKNDNKKQIQEDVPELRSVMLARPAMPPPMSFASMGPPSLKTSQQSATVQKSAPAASTPSIRWQVSQLPQLEQHYPLGRTNVYVPNVEAQEVANRICNFLKHESVSATPDNNDKVRLFSIEHGTKLCRRYHVQVLQSRLLFSYLQTLLNAETSNCVRFAVRLFSDQGMTVVEVQRMAGCGFEFSQVAKGVCRSAKGLTSAPKRKLPPMPSCIPRQSPAEQERRMECGIRMALDMMLSPRADLQMLGLQSLQQITASPSFASLSIVDMVLKGDSIVKLLSLIVATESLSETEQRTFVASQRMALSVLSQCLKAVSNDKLSSLLLDVKGVELKDFVSALARFLDSSASTPHEALFATRCLQCMATIPEVEIVLRDMDLQGSVDKACASGAISNVLLEAESEKLRTQLS